jgi:hypothetical protein
MTEAITPAQARNNEMSQQIKRLAELFLERSTGLGYKGKKRDDFALEYFVGAAALARVTGQEDLCQRLSALVNYTISIKGFIAVNEILRS